MTRGETDWLCLDYYRQTPPKVPNFLKTLFRRKIVLWFLGSEILRDYWLSGVSFFQCCCPSQADITPPHPSMPRSRRTRSRRPRPPICLMPPNCPRPQCRPRRYSGAARSAPPIGVPSCRTIRPHRRLRRDYLPCAVGARPHPAMPCRSTAPSVPLCYT